MVCPRCMNHVPNDADFCRVCDFDLDGYKQEEERLRLERMKELGLALAEGIDDLSSDPESLFYGRRLRGIVNFLSNIFLYPFRGMGPFVLVFGSAIFLMTWFSPPAAILWMGYMALYFFDVITTSSTGKNEPPDWPEYSGIWDWTSAIAMIVALLAVAFGPIAYFVSHLFLSGGEMTEQNLKIFIGLILWACIYLPMGLFVIANTKNSASLNPLTVIFCVLTAPFRYTLACLCLVIALLPQTFLILIILSTSNFFAEILSLPTAIYTVMVVCRILGLFYEDPR